MGRKRTGTIKLTRDGRWQPVVTFRGERVPLDPLPAGTSKPKARETAAYWAAETERREKAGLGLDGKPLPTTRTIVPVAADVAPADGWVEKWAAERRRRGLGSVSDNEAHYRHHIRPVLGGIKVADWLPADLRRLVAALDEKVLTGTVEWKTAKNIWGTASKMCSDAHTSKVEALRCREDNPAANVEGPDRGVEKGKVYLYPSEALALLACTDVPLRWRRWVALSLYTGVRAGELRVLRWADVNLEHQQIHVHRAWSNKAKRIKPTKGMQNRHVPIEPTLLPLLQAIRAESPDAEMVAPEIASECLLATELRDRYLPKAGVNRVELHEQSDTSKRFGWHDLRTTNATWLAVRGDDPLRIQARLGHQQFSTTQSYIVEANNVRAGFGEPFPPLPPGLGADPESFAESFPAAQVYETTASPAGFENEKHREIPVFCEDRQGLAPSETRGNLAGPGGYRSRGNDSSATGDALELALVEAARDKQWDVVRQLGRELEARRLDAGAGKVVPLRHRQGDGGRTRGR